MDEVKPTASQPEFECLWNRTIPKVVSQGRDAVCGNGILEAPEQCDCGWTEVGDKHRQLI